MESVQIVLLQEMSQQTLEESTVAHSSTLHKTVHHHHPMTSTVAGKCNTTLENVKVGDKCILAQHFDIKDDQITTCYQ